MKKSKEIWKDILEFENMYQISNLGNVKGLKRTIKGNKSTWTKEECILKIFLDKKGYSQIRLSKENIKTTKKIHRLVAIAFLPNPDNKPQVNHKDGIKTNNYPSNLEWCTNSENQIHAYKKGLNKHTENHNIANAKKGLLKRKLSAEDVINLRKMRENGLTYKKIGEHFNISGKFVEQIIKNKKYVNNF